MRSKTYYIIFSSLLICSFLAFIEHGIEINYLIKTLLKIVLIFGSVIIYIGMFRDFRFTDVTQIHGMKKREWFRLCILGLASALVVLIAFFIAKPFIDLATIKEDLVDRLGMTPISFIFVSLYITFGNSFIEEYYFRGFIFFNLPKKVGYFFSPLMFALYHIPMIVLWFNSIVILICFVGLWIIGFVFHKVNEQYRTIWSSWIIHICADIIIVLIGFTLFY